MKVEESSVESRMEDTVDNNPIRAALRLLGENGERWVKGIAYNGRSRCMGAALGPHKKLEAIEILKKTTEELFPHRYSSPIWFNDDPATIFDDVRVVMEKAAVKWDEQYG